MAHQLCLGLCYEKGKVGHYRKTFLVWLLIMYEHVS